MDAAEEAIPQCEILHESMRKYGVTNKFNELKGCYIKKEVLFLGSSLSLSLNT